MGDNDKVEENNYPLSFSSDIPKYILRSSSSKFDAVQTLLYNLVVSAGSNVSFKRVPYKISDSTDVYFDKDQKLNDQDRLLLGKVLFNTDSVFEYGVGESTLIAQYTN